ncbi:tyrosine-protein phosphatase [Ensifer sp. M14]|uniref:tyrosine-protein phosphatase n=1 Tax=Ensifer sp. M14 TaxID=2203782 RepID=UPI001FCE4EBA|nr:tyrosine-protein phosphatase [Ensifer sp. M14]
MTRWHKPRTRPSPELIHLDAAAQMWSKQTGATQRCTLGADIMNTDHCMKVYLSRRAAITVAALAILLAVAPRANADEAAPRSPGQSLGIVSVPNLRDVGGYATGDGRVVRMGLLYRSDQLNPISPDDLKKIVALGLNTDFDLRTADERSARPDKLPAGITNVWLNVLADADQSSLARLEKLLLDPKQANAALGGGKAEAMFEQAYRDFVSLPSAKTAYRRLFLSLGESDNPSLFHCTTGKDRTGWAAAALLSLLGVPRDKVMEDFLRSNDYILPAYKKTIDAFVAAGGDEEIMTALLGVKSDYLQASFDEVQSKYGSIDLYFSEGLGIDAKGQTALRNFYLAKQ